MSAAALANEARTMDLADRFINSECVKRMLQADQVFAMHTRSSIVCFSNITVVSSAIRTKLSLVFLISLYVSLPL
jgi:hypothetical protein